MSRRPWAAAAYRSAHDEDPGDRRRRLCRLGLGRGVPACGSRRGRPRRPDDRPSRRRARGRARSTRARTPTPTRWPACSSPSGSRPSSIARRARWSVNRSPTRRRTTATTSPAASRSSRRPAPRRSSGSSSRRPRPSTASRTSPRSPRTRRSGRSTPTASRSARSKAPSPGTAGVRPAQRDASATSTWPARPRRSARTTTPRPTSSRTSSAPPKAARASTIFGDDYPTPDGTCIRDYIHVADLADAHLRAIEATAPGDPRTDDALVCNLGNGGGFSVREVLAAAEAVVGRPIPSTVGPRRAGDPPVLVARADRAAEVLGWRPARPSLEEMVGSAWAWRLEHPDGYRD